MELGEWVLKKRKAQDLDIQSFADGTGVNVGTISRIENKHTQPTIVTTFRLVEGLGATLSALLKDLNEDYSLHYEPSSLVAKNTLTPSNDTSLVLARDTLTLSDVEKLVFDYKSKRDGVRFYLLDKLNRVSWHMSDVKRNSSADNALLEFDVDDIDKILLASSLYRFELNYPPRINPAIIGDIYDKGGTIIHNDIGAYLRGMPFSAYPKTLLHERLVASPGSLERLKFAELLSADKELGVNGKLLGIFWEVCRFNEKFNPPMVVHLRVHQQSLFDFEEDNSSDVSTKLGGRRTLEHKIASLYVLVYRWYQAIASMAEPMNFEKY